MFDNGFHKIHFAFFAFIFILGGCKNQEEELKLWYTKPATKWVEAFSEGNGRLELNATKAEKVSGRILTSPKIQDGNTFDNPENVTIKSFNDAKLKGNKLEVNMPANSVIVMELAK
jgi:hypothetical protein